MKRKKFTPDRRKLGNAEISEAVQSKASETTENSGAAGRIVVGIQFRSSGDRERVIQRAQAEINHAYKNGVNEGISATSRRIEDLKMERMNLAGRIRKLEASIRQIKSHQAEEIIFAIANLGHKEEINCVERTD